MRYTNARLELYLCVRILFKDMVNGQKVYQLEDSILYEAYQNNLTMLSPCPQQINDPQEARITVRAQKLE